MSNRRDGIRVKNIDGMHSLMPHIMPKRTAANVYINTKIDVTELVKYLEKLRKKDEYKSITFFHLFCTAIGKTAYNRPLMNRFIVNKRFYDRKDVKISFVAKKEFTDKAEESMQVLTIKENDDLFSISEQTRKSVHKLRSSQEHGVDKLMVLLGKMPKWLRSILWGIIKFGDNHDLLPTSLTKDLLYYSTVIVANLGSIDCGSIYHHLTDFGTNSVFMVIGQIKDEVVAMDGKPTVRKMCEFGLNIDERIADGFYFIKTLKLFEYILQNPHLLEENANMPIEVPKVRS